MLKPSHEYSDGDSIKVDEGLFQAIAIGKKKTTIREGIRLIKPGSKLRIETNDGRHIVKCVSSVTLKKLEDITEQDVRHDGFGTRSQLVRTLKKFYPGLTDSDIVTIISFQ